MAVEFTAFDCGELVSDIARTVLPLARANGNKFEMVAAPNLGAVRSDPFRLRQCLLNLCSNAAKFTSQGVIGLTARRRGKGARMGIVFKVSDTGMGMSRETQVRIFEPFRQADESIERQFVRHRAWVWPSPANWCASSAAPSKSRAVPARAPFSLYGFPTIPNPMKTWPFKTGRKRR